MCGMCGKTSSVGRIPGDPILGMLHRKIVDLCRESRQLDLLMRKKFPNYWNYGKFCDAVLEKVKQENPGVSEDQLSQPFLEAFKRAFFELISTVIDDRHGDHG
ncbi:hypothetical protein [Shimazuella alba]|uniref:Uncharacterized protein n=1 Tax=Shimazuella alba TaxID=2690964 RepID=A0A6I4W4M2_9BACL|nr:hypothetical protein [Shimazuella alba]MXQ55724.1 hypothetical protein [Shimazuella alba]